MLRHFMLLDESDMKGVENAVEEAVPKPVGLGMCGIANEGTFDGAVMEFRVVHGDEGESTAADFSKMRNGGFATVP